MLELVSNFFDRFCDQDKYEFIEMDTDSLYLAVSEKEVEDMIRSEMKEHWNDLRAADCRSNFGANSPGNFFPRRCSEVHNKFDQRTPGLFKEEFRCTEMIVLCSKTYCCLDEETQTIKLSAKGINKTALINDDPMEKYRSVLQRQEQVENVIRGFRVVGSSKVCTYQLTKKGLAYFYAKRKVCDDGFQIIPLDI